MGNPFANRFKFLKRGVEWGNPFHTLRERKREEGREKIKNILFFHVNYLIVLQFAFNTIINTGTS